MGTFLEKIVKFYKTTIMSIYYLEFFKVFYKLSNIWISVKKIFYLNKNLDNSLNKQLLSAKLGEPFIS